LVRPPSMMGAWDGDWLSTFAPWTLFHIATVAVCAGAMLAACVGGRCWHPGEKERRFRVAWGWVVLAYQTWYVIWYAMPGRWDWKESLPFQLCDLAAFVAGLAMITQWRPWRTLLYFWGIGLSTQAFFTPIVTTGLASAHFWMFWIGHTMIVGSAVYDVVVRGYRPRMWDLGMALGVTTLYATFIFGFDVVMTRLLNEPINYLYIGPSRPTNPTLVDKLGPWPWRALAIGAIGIADFIVIWAVWPLARRLTGGKDPLGAAAGACD
jgi:hypothetical integral membrane protein (TIGR02206 family)